MKKIKVETTWLEAFNQIKKYRESHEAAVDTMGCDKLFDKNAPEKVQRFQILVSLLLSSQTRDQVTSAAVERLKLIPLNVETMCKISLPDLEQVLNPVCFYKTKAKNLKAIAEQISNSKEQDIPDSLEEILKLPGIGPKMGHLIMQVAWNQTLGIAVDLHVHRISNRLGWTNSKTPEESRSQLERLFPKSCWVQVNTYLVGFGQLVCKQKPRCQDCPVTSCPSRLRDQLDF